ncbi:MAG: helix-turn-helix domain-containing protein [Lachnospiraceae bacterium]
MITVKECYHNHAEQIGYKVKRPEGCGNYVFTMYVSPMTFEMHSKEILTSSNACVLYTPDYPQKHRSAFANDPIVTCSITFEFTDDELTQFHIPFNIPFYTKRAPIINEYFAKIYKAMQYKEPYYQVEVDAYARLLFMEVSRSINAIINTELEDSKDMVTLFEKCRLAILSTVDDDWSSQKMADLTSLSTTQFYKYYNNYFGQTPKAELLEQRYHIAKALLERSSFTVSEISARLGFNCLDHFTKFFKARGVISPTQYRKKVRGLPYKKTK